ncbi:MAG: RpiB/LacA/LacB family sugar-phosphate isomerase [Patescibacteria group bacterium]
MPKVYVASDHAGYELKSQLISYIGTLGYEVEDMGALTLDPADDYPDFITPCAKQVAGESGSFGIIIGASGQGEAMAANRIPGIRAAVYYGAPRMRQTDMMGQELDLIESARAHNDANILSLGARFLSEGEAQAAVQAFLSTEFSNDARHVRRISKF